MSLHTHIGKDGFRLRGVELARIDAFSDVVFGFALTLLVVSLEVPRTYAELHEALRGFVPFGVCFYLLMVIWYGHYKFFRRFGVHDVGTIYLNGALLFVILFYVYPLKFLFTFVVLGMLGHWSKVLETYGQLRELMYLFGVGFAAIYLLLAGLYANGYRQRDALELTPVERLLARSYVVTHAGIAVIGLLSCLLARLLPERNSGLAGLTFLLILPFRRIYGIFVDRRVTRLRDALSIPLEPVADVETI